MFKFLLAYRYAVGAGIITWLSLFLMQKFALLWVFVLIVLILGGLLVLFSLIIKKRFSIQNQFIPLLITTTVAAVCLTSLIELPSLRYFLDALFSIIIGLLFFYPIHREYAIHFEQKPWRRMMTMLWVFDSYAIITVVFALGLLFPMSPYWLLALAGGALFGFSSTMIWQMYFIEEFKKISPWIIVISLIMFEVIWSAHFLPLGHLALGLSITWIWYIIQLLIRFSMGGQGIVWGRQWKFLVVNTTLFLLLLIFVVRWI